VNTPVLSRVRGGAARTVAAFGTAVAYRGKGPCAACMFHFAARGTPGTIHNSLIINYLIFFQIIIF